MRSTGSSTLMLSMMCVIDAGSCGHCGEKQCLQSEVTMRIETRNQALQIRTIKNGNERFVGGWLVSNSRNTKQKGVPVLVPRASVCTHALSAVSLFGKTKDDQCGGVRYG